MKLAENRKDNFFQQYKMMETNIFSIKYNLSLYFDLVNYLQNTMRVISGIIFNLIFIMALRRINKELTDSENFPEEGISIVCPNTNNKFLLKASISGE